MKISGKFSWLKIVTIILGIFCIFLGFKTIIFSAFSGLSFMAQYTIEIVAKMEKGISQDIMYLFSGFFFITNAVWSGKQEKRHYFGMKMPLMEPYPVSFVIIGVGLGLSILNPSMSRISYGVALGGLCGLLITWIFSIIEKAIPKDD